MGTIADISALCSSSQGSGHDSHCGVQVLVHTVTLVPEAHTIECGWSPTATREEQPFLSEHGAPRLTAMQDAARLLAVQGDRLVEFASARHPARRWLPLPSAAMEHIRVPADTVAID